MRISAPRSRGCSLPRSTAQSRTRSLRSIPLPAHLQFHPAPVKSLHARSNLKLLPFSTEALRLRHTVCVADVERVCCVTAAEQIRFTSILFCRGHLIRAYSAGSVARLGGLPPKWASFDRLGPENNALGG